MKIILPVLILISSLFAHPHTFIEVYPTIKIKENKTSSIHFKWVIDEMTSASLLMELDSDMNGVINKEENSYTFENYFSTLRDYNYYTYIKVDNKLVSLPNIENFKVSIENNKICYSFDIKGSYPVGNTVFEFGDTEFYVAMMLKDTFIKLDGATATTSKVDNDLYLGYKLELK